LSVFQIKIYLKIWFCCFTCGCFCASNLLFENVQLPAYSKLSQSVKSVSILLQNQILFAMSTKLPLIICWKSCKAKLLLSVRFDLIAETYFPIRVEKLWLYRVLIVQLPQWKLHHLIKLHFDTVNYSHFVHCCGIKSDNSILNETPTLKFWILDCGKGESILLMLR
jgi:hypothetical protein